jgi:ubiquitin-conjugating enzyme E2 Z
MSSNPYENEPGFENAKSAADMESMTKYVAKVFLYFFLGTCYS